MSGLFSYHELEVDPPDVLLHLLLLAKLLPKKILKLNKEILKNVFRIIPNTFLHAPLRNEMRHLQTMFV